MLAKCYHCEEILQTSMHGRILTVKHVCPDGHLEERFKNLPDISEEEYQEALTAASRLLD